MATFYQQSQIYSKTLVVSARGMAGCLHNPWLRNSKLNTNSLLSSHTSAQLPVGFLYLSQLSLCLSQGCHIPPGIPGCGSVTYILCDYDVLVVYFSF